jgi:AAA15 family ATPase/GTPase
MMGPMVDVLDKGHVLLDDELSASLHPHLAAEIIRMFLDPAVNPRQAQLVFATHDTTPLGNLGGRPVLERDQVWLAEKDADGASRIYPLTDFSPRRVENLERGYLQGRYGAVPFFDRERLAAVTAESAAKGDDLPEPEV